MCAFSPVNPYREGVTWIWAHTLVTESNLMTAWCVRSCPNAAAAIRIRVPALKQNSRVPSLKDLSRMPSLQKEQPHTLIDLTQTCAPPRDLQTLCYMLPALLANELMLINSCRWVHHHCKPAPPANELLLMSSCRLIHANSVFHVARPSW
jgi:hypothetical protein